MGEGTKKAILVVYDASIHEEVMEALTGSGVRSFTRFQNVTGSGRASGPHLGTHVWPATNSALLLVVEEEEASRVLEAVRGLRQRWLRTGVKAFCWPIETCT